MDCLNIGLIGYGVVGQGVVKVLKSRRKFLREKYETDFIIKTLCDRSIFKKPNTVSITATLETNDSGKNILWKSSNTQYASIGIPNVSLNVSTILVTYYKAGIGKIVNIIATNNNNNTNSTCSINILK